MNCIVRGAAAVLATGGVFAIALRNTADFGGKGPVPNLVHHVTAMIEEAVGGNFLGDAVVKVGRARSQAHHEGEWLMPEVWHLLSYRGT